MVTKTNIRPESKNKKSAVEAKKITAHERLAKRLGRLNGKLARVEKRQAKLLARAANLKEQIKFASRAATEKK